MAGRVRAGSGVALLAELERVARSFGGGAAEAKRGLLERVGAARLPTADAVLRFHEVLCFLRSVPDDAALLGVVEDLLAGFDERADLRRHRRELADSGVAGTDIHYPFFAATARWLAARWGGNLHLDWGQLPSRELLAERLYMVSLDAETPGLDQLKLTPRQWVERMKGEDETDAAYLVRRFGAVRWDPDLRDTLFNELGLPFVLRAGPDTPSRTRARLPGGRVVWQRDPLRRARPDLTKEVRRPPLAVRRAGLREGKRIVDLARGAMVTRARDLDAFLGADPTDVRLVDCGEGLEFAVMGVVPDWRILFESMYGWIVLRNRVPMGYVLTSSLFRSAEVALNIFDTWRGGDAAWVYGRALATARHLFGAETFCVPPYQLGHGNAEGLASGAWWFYQKLGFRARDPEVLALMEAELARMRRRPGHRSSVPTLKKLTGASVFLECGRHRDTVVGTFPAGPVGLAVTTYLASRFGSQRERGERVCAEEAGRRLGAPGWRRFPRHERSAWQKWAPLVCALPGVERWTAAERRALVRVVRAKGGPRESEFVRLFDAHPKLTKALLRLAAKHSAR